MLRLVEEGQIALEHLCFSLATQRKGMVIFMEKSIKTADIFKTLEQKVPGLNKPNLILLAARPSMGKTSLALNLALSVAKEANVAVFSLEMPREKLISRFLSPVTPGKNHRPYIETIQIDDSPLLTAADIYAKCCRIDNLGLVVIDYLQLITPADGQNLDGKTRRQTVSDISRTLKTMAKELNVPVICLSQLSRSVEKRDNKRPVLSDFREFGAAVQEADIVLFLYRDDYYNEKSKKRNIAECIIAKNLHGEIGTLELRWISEYARFSTLN